MHQLIEPYGATCRPGRGGCAPGCRASMLQSLAKCLMYSLNRQPVY
jgi:hypothetical protein